MWTLEAADAKQDSTILTIDLTAKLNIKEPQAHVVYVNGEYTMDALSGRLLTRRLTFSGMYIDLPTESASAKGTLTVYDGPDSASAKPPQ